MYFEFLHFSNKSRMKVSRDAIPGCNGHEAGRRKEILICYGYALMHMAWTSVPSLMEDDGIDEEKIQIQLGGGWPLQQLWRSLSYRPRPFFRKGPSSKQWWCTYTELRESVTPEHSGDADVSLSLALTRSPVTANAPCRISLVCAARL